MYNLLGQLTKRSINLVQNHIKWLHVYYSTNIHIFFNILINIYICFMNNCVAKWIESSLWHDKYLCSSIFHEYSLISYLAQDNPLPQESYTVPSFCNYTIPSFCNSFVNSMPGGWEKVSKSNYALFHKIANMDT